MKEYRKHIARKIYFSCWSRKGYAIFAALGKEVCISRVGQDICESALLKSAGKGIIIDESGCAEMVTEDEYTGKTGCYNHTAIKGEVCPDGRLVL